MTKTTALPAFLLLCLAACAPDGPGSEPPPAPAPPQEPIGFEFALFYPEPPREEPQAALDALLASEFSGITRVDEIPEKDLLDRRLISAGRVTDGSYAAPDLEGLELVGRGLDQAQSEALQETKNVLVLDFRHGRNDVWTGLRDAMRLTSALARRTGGLIWDNASAEMFTPEAWDEERIGVWTEAEGPTDVRPQITIRSVRKENGLHRMVTLGMEKLGLPDLVAVDVSGSATASMAGAINVLAQRLAEGASTGEDGTVEIDLDAIRNAAMKEEKLGSLKANATRKAQVRLVPGVHEEGESLGRLSEISFDGYPGPDVQARQERMLSTLFGSEDATADVEHGEQVLEASRRAHEKLLALEPAFQAGLPPGDTLLVKAPFQTPDGGREWMWVEVMQWHGGTIRGTLQNDPVKVPGLKSGQQVEVRAADVFDYLHKHADGSAEGNETAKYLYPQG
ncbi:MAG: DUF2314 domain-containing protein [Acidobacteriota bacterium]